jgi:DNA polymerase-3 subunit delta
MPSIATPCTVFSGADEFRRRRALAAALDRALPAADRDFNLTRCGGKSLDAVSLATAIDTPPLFADRRVVIVEEAHLLTSPVLAVLVASVTRSTARGDDSVLVLVDVGEGKKPDKTLLATGAAHETFDAMRARDAAGWLRTYAQSSGASLPTAVADAIVQAVGPEASGPLAREVDKLAALASGRAITLEDVAQATADTATPTPYPLYDAVGTRRYAAAHAALEHVLTNPDFPGVRLVIGLAMHLTQVGVARARLDAGDAPGAISQSLGGWMGEKYVTQARGWSLAELDAALVALKDTDLAIKSGRADRATLSLFLARALT